MAAREDLASVGEFREMPVADSVKLGRDVKIFQPTLVNLYGCSVGDETKIGAFVESKLKKNK